MSQPLTKQMINRVLGQTRLQRLIHAGWLAPLKNNDRSVLFDPKDVHAALRRLEREPCPPNKAEVLRIRLSEVRNGRGRTPKERKPGPHDIVLDFSAFPPAFQRKS